MLNWLAGQKAHENEDPDATGYVEPPETPAPVFAVRAFKHAIFGTPATTKPRRHSNNETSRPRQNGRPGMSRPKSANETQTVAKYENALDDAPGPSSPLPSSPTKGILLTPGTATAKRKTVSFGLSVVDNEQKRPLKSGLPDDCPGKFPSPWSKPTAEIENTDEPAATPKHRSKLTEALEQARDESAKRKSRSSRQSRTREDPDTTMDLAEPVSDSGRYWKREYDIYRERTTREVRKLVEKQQSAKRYAREKDSECQELQDQLREEQAKIEKLEKRTVELEAQLREFQGQMKNDREQHADLKEETIRSKRSSAPALKAKAVESATTQQPETEKPERPERPSWRTHDRQYSRQDLKTEVAATSGAPADGKPEQSRTARDELDPAESRTRPRRVQRKKPEDLWLQSSSLDPPKTDQANPPSPRSSRAVTSGTDATPLKSLSVNSLAQKDDSLALAMSMGMQPPSPQRENRQDSPMRSPGLPLPSPESPVRTEPRPQLGLRRNSKAETAAHTVPESSPFQPEATSERPNVLTGQPVPIKPWSRPTAKTPDVKENVSPSSRARNEENVKPSAAWNAMSNVAAERRIVSKDGKEIEQDRLAKARARLQNRGRQVS